MISNYFFNKVGCGILVCKNDPYSTIIEANNSFYSMIGYTREEMQQLHRCRFSELVIDDLDEILKKVRHSVKLRHVLDYEFRIKHKLGHTIWIHDVAVYDEEEDVFNVVIMDITYKAKALELAEYAASRDKLTGLLNRDTLENRVRAQINKNKRMKPQVMFIIDIDNFKMINDVHGHQMGDRVITYVGEKLNSIFDHEFIVGRLGGDEFMIFSNWQHSKEDIYKLSQRIVKELKFDCGNIKMSISVGVFLDTLAKYDFDELYKYTDKALYRVKNKKKGKYEILIE